MTDYLIVGLGLAGISFCETLENHGKTFMVISDESQTSSLVAGGLYNPVNLKRFTLAWKAKEQLDMTSPFYRSLEKKLGVVLDHKIPVLRRFASIGEQNGWFEAADKPMLSPFLSPVIKENVNSCLTSPFGYGEVLNTGRIDTEKLLSSYRNYLNSKGLLLQESFAHATLQIKETHIAYKSIVAKQLIFAEGFGLKGNPFFDYLPLNGNKGEFLSIKAPSLRESNVIKSSFFLIPMGSDVYRVGATYNRHDKSKIPTREAKDDLLQKLDIFLNCEYQTIDHVTGIRPTVSDKRPLVGRHPEYHNIYVLNGFGSRGVMIAPYAANQLYRHIEHEKSIDPEMDCSRFRYTKNNF